MARRTLGVGFVAAWLALCCGAHAGIIGVKGFQMPAGAQQGYVLTCDATGTATWQSPPGGVGNDNDWAVVGSTMHAAVSGNVGIGTASPSAKLDVVGDAEVNGDLAVSGGITLGGVRRTAWPTDGLTSLNSVTSAGGNIDLVSGGGIAIIPNDANDTITIAVTGAGSNWSLTGNSGTNPATQFVGTTDATALELRVNSARALRLEPHATSPNVVGGYNGNSIGAGVYGAAIAGGGSSGSLNEVTGNYSAIGGGLSNTASSDRATIGGGNANSATSSFTTVGGGYNNAAGGPYATVGGGGNNNASDTNATVAGGEDNTASGASATVGGGYLNAASGYRATVPGGDSCVAAGDYSFAAGNRAKANHAGAFVWADFTPADFASTTEQQFSVRATGGVRLFVNTAGGGLSVDADTTSPNIAAGHSTNAVTAGAYGCAIGGGGTWSDGNLATDSLCTVGGGARNQAGDNAGSTGDANYGTVAGGYYNTASHYQATVAGGYENSATHLQATVGGGHTNSASGAYATVPGGQYNTAQGQYSFAAGRRAKAYDDGSFVWSDSSNEDFASTLGNRFYARAVNGFFLYTATAKSAGVYVGAGQGSWSSVSDRNRKEAVVAVDPEAVLAKLVAVPVSTWSYTTDPSGFRHMGPMAQDLHAAFGLGDSDKAIATIDADGISMAAIQGLHRKLEAKDAEVAELKARLARLEALLATRR